MPLSDVAYFRPQHRVLGKNKPLTETFIMKTDDKQIETQAIDTTTSPDEQQQELQRLYNEQQQRLSCPGCGEGHQVF